MTDPMHQQLLGHLLGALDDDEQEWVEARLQHDEEYRRHWVALRRRMAPLLALRPDTEPPPDLAQQTCRLVASFATFAPKPQSKSHRKMSPDCTLSDRPTHFGWLDLAAAAMILVVIGILVPPAIQNSRFQSRLASCQNRLRQVGLGLTQYGYHHGNQVSVLADNERLTDAGRFVADLIDSGVTSDDGRDLCPDAWLAAQGALPSSRRVGSHATDLRSPTTAGPKAVPLSPSAWVQTTQVSNRAWSGISRNGTNNDVADPPPAAVALLADAPSADMPGQIADVHDGQGRNMFFEDGHVDFLHCSDQRDAADRLLSRDDSSAHVSAPIRFVDWH